MTDWKARVGRLIRTVDALSDAVRARVTRLCGRDGPVRILPYLGYGTAHTLYITGRVLAGAGYAPAEADDTAWENLVNFYQRLTSAAVPGARIRARFRGDVREVTADDDGVFRLAFHTTTALHDRLWQEVALELLPPRAGPEVRALARALVPPPSARVGVISDIDDTVVWTNVGNKAQMLLTVALLNERTRLPCKGVAPFYQALQRGADGQAQNPFFYVSSSPWQLHEP